MSFIKEALEECNNCGTNQVNQVDGWKGAPDPKAVVNTGATFDDGDGVKDTVVISGPLSHAYTQALLLTLKKEPLQNNKEEPVVEEVKEEKAEESDPLLKKKNDDQIGIATETNQQDEDIEIFLAAEMQKNPEDVSYLANKFDFVHQNQLPVNVVCKTTLISMTDFMKIEKFMEFTENRSDSSVQYAVVVLPDSLNRTSTNTSQLKFIDVASVDIEGDNLVKEFKAAVEAYVEPAGYKVFMGLESYFKFLRTLSKDLTV